MTFHARNISKQNQTVFQHQGQDFIRTCHLHQVSQCWEGTVIYTPKWFELKPKPYVKCLDAEVILQCSPWRNILSSFLQLKHLSCISKQTMKIETCCLSEAFGWGFFFFSFLNWAPSETALFKADHWDGLNKDLTLRNSVVHFHIPMSEYMRDLDCFKWAQKHSFCTGLKWWHVDKKR